MKITSINHDPLADYDLLFIGSACHDADLAKPVLKLLDDLPQSPSFKVAGFVTHSTYKAEGGKRREELHERWAGKCKKSFSHLCEEKNIEFLGYFNCLGAPSPEIADFIHREIVTDDNEWNEYIEEVMIHPDQADIEEAENFAKKVIDKLG